MTLVSLGQAKQMLRIDHNDDDAVLALLLESASRTVTAYLGDRAATVLPADAVVPEDVQVATAMLAGYLHRSPDADPDKAFGHGRLPLPVTALLYPYRDPPLA